MKSDLERHGPRAGLTHIVVRSELLEQQRQHQELKTTENGNFANPVCQLLSYCCLGTDSSSSLTITSQTHLLFMSPTSNHIAGFGSCLSSLILSETLYIVFSSGI